MPSGMSSGFWPLDGLKSLWSSGGACGNAPPGGVEEKRQKSNDHSYDHARHASNRQALPSKNIDGTSEATIRDVYTENMDPISSYKVHELERSSPQPQISSEALSKAIDAELRCQQASPQVKLSAAAADVPSDRALSDAEEAEAARREAARLREALQRAEEKIASHEEAKEKVAAAEAGPPSISPSKKVVRQTMSYSVQQEEIFEVPHDMNISKGQMLFQVVNKPITAPQLDLPHAAPVQDNLSVTAPPRVQSSSSRKRPIQVQVEAMNTAPPSAVTGLTHSGSMRAEDACWRVRHVRCDNAKMPTALRSRPSGNEPPLKDAIVEPGEEVLVLDSCPDPQDPNSVWTRVSCAKGEGWMKRMHLKEGGWRMRHVRGDNANIPTALRERPTATAKPLQAVKAEAHEEVLVHLQQEVIEGGRPTTWARVACSSGEGWLKREHLKEVLPASSSSSTKRADIDELGATSSRSGGPKVDELSVSIYRPSGPKIEELPDDSSEGNHRAVASSSPRSPEQDLVTPPGGPTPTSQSASASKSMSSAMPPTVVSPTRAVSSTMPPTAPAAAMSTIISATSAIQPQAAPVADDNIETNSEYPASSIRVRLGVLEFVSNSVGTVGMFDTVSFRAAVCLGGAVVDNGPTPMWVDDGPHTEGRTMKYGRSISSEGRYEAKFCCHFDESLDLPWPAPDPGPDKIAVDLYMERTTVVDHFDRVMSNLGLHTAAGIERRWLGRACADLPPEGCDDMPFAWRVESSGLEGFPIPQTISVGVEWVYEHVVDV